MNQFESYTTEQLRAMFLRESKKFLKTLDFGHGKFSEDLRDQMLKEIRDNLKILMKEITKREKEEAGSSTIKTNWKSGS